MHVPTELDGAQLPIVASRFEGIASKMGNTLLRAGRSAPVNRARDFSCCVVTASGDLLAYAESIPIHVLGADLLVASMREFHPDLAPGDAFLHNSPYHGNTHAGDHVILVPVFDDARTHRYTMVCKAHQADIGNSLPTTYHAEAGDVYEEGALIFPCVRVQRDYEEIEDVIRMCQMRIRIPEQWYGDHIGMVAAARIGERELVALAGDMGWDLLARFDQQWLDYSEQRIATAIGELPATRATAVSVHDAIPGTPAEGIAIRSNVTVTPAEGAIEVDLRDNPDNLPCGLNMTEATARAAALIGVFNSLDPTIPKNGGSARRVTVRLRDGYVSDGEVNPAQGVRGGLGAVPAWNRRRMADGREEALPQSGLVTLAEGDTVACLAQSGGHYGRADRREPARVLRDVRQGIVTRDRAREVYRVAIDDAWALDGPGTQRLRDEVARQGEVAP